MLVGASSLFGSALRLFVRNVTGSHTPKGNFSPKRGNKNFYKGRGGNKYGVPGPRGARLRGFTTARPVPDRAPPLPHFAGGFINRARPNWPMPDLAGFRVRPCPLAEPAAHPPARTSPHFAR